MYDIITKQLQTIAFTPLLVSPFGEKTETGTFSVLGDNSFLNRDTYLYCLTEKGTRVNWSYEDINGGTIKRFAATDPITGVSKLWVTNSKIGYYRCEVSQNGGDTRTYTTMMLPPRSGN